MQLCDVTCVVLVVVPRSNASTAAAAEGDEGLIMTVMDQNLFQDKQCAGFGELAPLVSVAQLAFHVSTLRSPMRFTDRTTFYQHKDRHNAAAVGKR